MTGEGVPSRSRLRCWAVMLETMYGIEGKLFVTEEPPPLERPDWFPQGPELDEWARLESHPRQNAEKLAGAAAGSAIGLGGRGNGEGRY